MATSSHAGDMPWVEKYRPRTLDEVVGNADAVARLRMIAQEGNLPNVIFSGPPGCGKTTSIMCLCRTLLGASRAKDAVLELNASDDRGIDVVRNKIKMFAQKKVSLPPGRHKVVILDEADSMTSGAQQALRRTMEVFSSTTRFALACNMSSKIIEPIQSRCAIIRFTRLGEKELMSRLVDVAEREHVATLPDGMEALVFTADGDMRQGLNNLQATAAGFGTVNAENVYRVCDQPHPMVLAGMISKCAEGRIEDAYAPLAKLHAAGYAASDIIVSLFRVAKSMDLPEYIKLEFVREIGFCHMRIAEGLDTILQLTGLLAKLCETAERCKKGR